MRALSVYASASDVYTWPNNHLNNFLPKVCEGMRVPRVSADVSDIYARQNNYSNNS